MFFFKPPIRSRSPLLTGSRLISLPLATQMFQFAKFSKSKERRLATELGYGFPIGDPWITDGISPWPFAFESVLPSQCPGIHPMHDFRSCTGYTEDQANLDKKRKAIMKLAYLESTRSFIIQFLVKITFHTSKLFIYDSTNDRSRGKELIIIRRDFANRSSFRDNHYSTRKARQGQP